MRKVTIVGAGFSGLTLAYQLHELGIQSVIYDKQNKVGGLIDTLPNEFGLVETAANAMIADRNVENLFADLDLSFAERLPTAKKRYIFWERPTRWPLTFKTSLKAVRAIFNTFVRGDDESWPDAGESMRAWAERVVNEEFAERMVGPALQGIYASDDSKLSASLILRALAKNRPPKGDFKGSVAPPGGMGELIDKLAGFLEQKGCEIRLKETFNMPEFITTPLVIATSAWNAAEILKTSHPAVSEVLQTCEALPLVRAVCFFKETASDLKGFGCLFPQSQGFNSLGVLFESCVFQDRSKVRSESWIIGGSRNPTVVALHDHEILETIRVDRERLMGKSEAPVSFHFTRWQRALPHYTCEWEQALQTLKVDPPLYLHGNYLGHIGLGQILNRSAKLAQQIKDNYG